MLKSFRIGIILYCCALCTKVFAQSSFHKGALVTELKTGLEVYNLYASLWQDLGSRTRDTLYEDKAGNTYFGLGAEYGLHKMIGVGATFSSHKFFAETDSTTGKKNDTQANNFLVLVNFHPIATKKFDLVIGGDIGYSRFKLKTFDKDNTVLTGGGIAMSAYLNPRIYFGRFGINFKLSTPYLKYNNVNTNNADFNKNNKYNYLKLSAAWCLGFGIQYRFLEEK